MNECKRTMHDINHGNLLRVDLRAMDVASVLSLVQYFLVAKETFSMSFLSLQSLDNFGKL